MAITIQDKSGYELTAGNGRKPRFIYNVAAAVKGFTPAGASAKWTTDGLPTSFDHSLPSAPAIYGIDNRGTYRTSCDLIAADPYHVISNPAASYGVDEVVDCMAIINHNFNTDNITSIIFYVSDDGTNWQFIRQETVLGTVNKRIWVPKFNTSYITGPFNAAGFTPQETTNARYFRIRGTNAMSTHPAMGEIFWGRSVFLKGGPLIQFDDKWEESDADIFEARSGERTQYLNYVGRRKRVFRYETADEEEIAALDRLWKNTAYGTGSFLFEAETNWESNESPPAMYRAEEPSRVFPISWGARGRSWSFSFVESPPYLAEGEI